MLAQTAVNNEEKTVYTVPQGKMAMIEIVVFSGELGNVWVKINDMVIFDEVVDSQFSQKFICTANDVIKVGTDVSCNVFISGMEV